MLQSPSRIEQLVKIFIHATKVRDPLRPLCFFFTDRGCGYGRWRLGSGTCFPANERVCCHGARCAWPSAAGEGGSADSQRLVSAAKESSPWRPGVRIGRCGR